MREFKGKNLADVDTELVFLNRLKCWHETLNKARPLVDFHKAVLGSKAIPGSKAVPTNASGSRDRFLPQGSKTRKGVP